MVINRKDQHRATTGDDVIRYTREKHHFLLNRPQVSRLLRRNRIHSRATQKRPAARLRETYNDEVQEFREQHGGERGRRVLREGCHRGWMDETGLYEDAIVPRSYAPAGGDGVSVGTRGRAGRRDTVVATLREDGVKAPMFWIEHSRAKRQRRPDGTRNTVPAVKVPLPCQYYGL